MRNHRQGCIRQQLQFLQSQYLQNGEMPLSNALTSARASCSTRIRWPQAMGPLGRTSCSYFQRPMAADLCPCYSRARTFPHVERSHPSGKVLCCGARCEGDVGTHRPNRSAHQSLGESHDASSWSGGCARARWSQVTSPQSIHFARRTGVAISRSCFIVEHDQSRLVSGTTANRRLGRFRQSSLTDDFAAFRIINTV